MDSQLPPSSSSSLTLSTPNTDLSKTAVEVVQHWARSSVNASQSQLEKLTLLLDKDYLLRLPRLKGMRRLSSPPSPAEIRHSFYRHAAKVLGWKDRSSFGAEVHHALKRDLWPDVEEDTELRPLKRRQHAPEVSNTVDSKKGESRPGNNPHSDFEFFFSNEPSTSYLLDAARHSSSSEAPRSTPDPGATSCVDSGVIGGLGADLQQRRD